MADFEIKMDMSAFEDSLLLMASATSKVSRIAMQDLVDETIRVVTDVAPIDKGTLRISSESKIKDTGSGLEGIITFSVLEGEFNYALWIHEGVYELGENSKQAGGGTGMSGTHYDVGNKFLERVINGEREAYMNYYAEKLIAGVMK